MRWLLILGLVGWLGCAERAVERAVKLDPAQPVRVVFATAHGEAGVTAEIADTPAAIDRGLMDRAHLPADDGMLFFMGRDKDWPFWMRDTQISLDIIFITRELRVAGVVHRMAPRSDRPRRVGTPSRYVLEVNAGWAAAHHIAPGTTVRFDNLKR